MSSKFLDEMRIAWNRYINYGEISEIVSPLLEKSWKRCMKSGVDPYGGYGTKISDKNFKKIVKENKELLEISKPIMENLNSLVFGTGFVMVLSDKNGVILHVIGEKNIKEEARKLLFSPGSVWTEEEVGTNAIGTCIKERKPIQIIGCEHFCKTHHNWTCSAAPIRNNKGEILGVINMSGYSSAAHKHTLGVVVAAAYSIENELYLSKSHAMIDTTVEAIVDGIIIIDKDYKINRINKAGEIILGLERNALDGKDIRSILGNSIFKDKDSFQKRIDWDFMIHEKRIPCNVKISPITLDNNIEGMTILFKEMKDVHKTVNIVSGNKATYTFDNILTKSPKTKKSIKEAKKYARTKGCVLIEGESGTGKELFAHAIHNYSSRRDGPFVAINCASLPNDLVESELFGYEKGAFTGAVKGGKIGKFELANGGTLFLDEIGEFPFNLQAKLLRVLDDYRITRIGGNVSKKLDVRVITATNRNLALEVKRKKFREDLYYRLNVFKVRIPPLRERVEDIPILANHFLKRLNLLNGTHKKIDKDFFESIEMCSWKGNIRELENLIERLYYLAEDDKITMELLPEDIFRTEMFEEDNILSIEEQEKKLIIKALEKTNGHVIEAGEITDISKSAMYRKLKKYNIDPEEYRQ